MTDKLNLSAIEEYSQSYARKLTNYFFIDNEVITGKQMLKFCDIQQVNLFVVNRLFDTWQQETARLRSPYFNYEAPEVKEALKTFMDTVSQYISVSRDNFEPLLAGGVYETILLLLSPQQYFEQWPALRNEQISVAYIKEKLRYFQVNKFVLKQLVERMESQSTEVVSTETALRWIEDIMGEHTNQLEQSDDYLALFSQKLPVDKEAFTEDTIAPSTRTRVPDHAEEALPVTALSSVETKPEQVESELANIVTIEIKASDPAIEEPKLGASEKSLHERLMREQPTLNETLRQVAAKETIMDRHLKTRIENIKSAIPLNQKFVFINELFRGDTAAYHQALNELEECANYQSATELLMRKYASHYGWNMESEEAESFFEIIERKFY